MGSRGMKPEIWLAGALLLLLIAWLDRAIAHPQCLDFKPPFRPSREYREFGCCEAARDRERMDHYYRVLSHLDPAREAACSAYVQDILCQGGSSAKGTSMKNGSDADLVVFISCFESFENLSEDLSDTIEEIREVLNKRKQSIAYDIDIKEPKEKLDPKGQLLPQRAVSFTIQSQKVMESISVDILPAYNVLGNISVNVKPDPKIYISLLLARGRPGQFSPCFTELQRNFVKPLPGKLKNLIRLVKHWYTEVKNKYQGIYLPPKYALELLTIYAWAEGSREDDFPTEEGFCTVLRLLCQYQKLCIYWTTNYDFENLIVGDFLRRQLTKPRPVILDPADPTGIVGQGASWDSVAEEAEWWLQSSCCLSNVEPWDVQVKIPVPQLQPQDKQILVQNSNGKTYTFHVRNKTSVQDIKTMVELRTRIPMEQQHLAYGNRTMKDDKTLKYYRIPNKAILFVTRLV